MKDRESLIEIVEELAKLEPAKKKYNFKVGVVARLHGCFNANYDTFWFMNGSANSSMYGKDDLKALGQFVPKNSRNAVDILNSELGTTITRGRNKFLMFNKSDFENKSISLLGDDQIYSYKDLGTFLSTLKQKQREIEENERRQKEKQEEIEELKRKEKTQHERGVLTKKLKELEEEHRRLTEQQEELSKLTKYIRQQGKLRYNPILDPTQNRIKTEHLYDGTTLIIDGGPGTGKTTTMIQRLKYLTDTEAIEEDDKEGYKEFKLTKRQIAELSDAIKEGKDWLFFSPSMLLKEYLADAMNREGLTNTNSKVNHWHTFRNNIIRDYYHLFDPTNDNAPFKASRETGILIYHHTDAVKAFDDFFVNQLRQIKNHFPKIEKETVKYKWASLAQNIQNSFNATDDYNIKQFVLLLLSLERNLAMDCRVLLSENTQTLKDISEELYVCLKDDEKKLQTVKDMIIPVLSIAEQNEESEEEDEEENIVDESFIENKIIRMIRQWFKRYCYSLKNDSIRLTTRQEQLSSILIPLLSNEHKAKIPRVGELVLFEQYAKYTRGVSPVLFRRIASTFKRFRQNVLTTKNEDWNLDLLDKLLKKKNGKELHPQEQSLLLGYINNMVKLVIKNGGKDTKDVFMTAYHELARPIIGVDEATDFCECDIYAMESFLTIDYNSMTLCGDMMQRLTEYGLHNWDDVKSIVHNPIVVDMRISYRQSTALLNVAKKLYTDSIGKEPNYKAYLKSTKVPQPLQFVSVDESEKVDWIEKRIKEVYIAYGKRLPSIAIFLNEKEKIHQFVKSLEETDFIEDTDIKVVDGSEGNILASQNQIRVYPIEVVKGMEFDVVFFHNIDSSDLDADLLKRYIYVGVSRAAFFLGITLNNESEEFCKYLERNKQWNKF